MIGREWTIERKIGFCFGILVVSLMTVNLLNYTGVSGIVRNASEVIDGHRLDGLLAQKELDHLNWANHLNASLNDAAAAGHSLETDPRQCAFGVWPRSEPVKALMADFPEFRQTVGAVSEPHRLLHETTVEIPMFLSDGARPFADQIYDDQVMPALAAVASGFNQILAAEQALLDANRAAKAYCDGATPPALDPSLVLLDRIQARADAMLDGTRQATAVFGRETLPTLRNTLALMGQVRSEVHRRLLADEVMLAAACQVSANSQSLAQRASEQAASLEQTSATLEEIVAMIQQNAESARTSTT